MLEESDLSWFEVLKFTSGRVAWKDTYAGMDVDRRKKRPSLAEKLVKISSLRTAEIYLFS